MKKIDFSSSVEFINGVTTPSTNSVNSSEMNETVFKLNIDFTGAEETEAISNQPALERIYKLANNGYYLFLQPKNSKRGGAYLWVKATKQGEDRIAFSLYVNDEILSVVVAILNGKPVNISGINADDLNDFNQRIKNFEFVLFTAEKAQGRTMEVTYTTNGQIYASYYKRGVISYKPYCNPELKAYLNA